jgi:F-type H+-transporting ATPase subunit b
VVHVVIPAQVVGDVAEPIELAVALQGEEPTQGEEFGETVDALEEEAVEEEAPNPILPVWSEMFWGGLAFLTLWALMKFVLLKPIQSTMQQRADKVRADLEEADRAKEAGVAAAAQYEASLASARAEAGRLIDDARAQADAQRREIIAAAEAEVAELKAAAAAEVAEAKAAALAQLRGDVGLIAVSAAEAVVQRPLDAASQGPIIDEYLSRASQN